MKTAISMPDATYQRVTKRAEELGVSRSEFLTRAAVAYLDDLDASSLTARITAAVELAGSDETARDVVAASKRRLSERDDDTW